MRFHHQHKAAEASATNPITRAHAADTAIIAAVVSGLPTGRRARPDPAPTAPAPITAKVAYAAAFPSVATVAKKTRNHAHIA